MIWSFIKVISHAASESELAAARIVIIQKKEKELKKKEKGRRETDRWLRTIDDLERAMTSMSTLRLNHQINDKSEWLQNIRQINIDVSQPICSSKLQHHYSIAGYDGIPFTRSVQFLQLNENCLEKDCRNVKFFRRDSHTVRHVITPPLAVLLINEKWTYIPKKSLMRLDKTMDKTDF